MNKKNKKRIKIGLLIIASFIALRLIFPPKIISIPDEVYAQLKPENPYYAHLTTGTKNIVWFGADCPISAMQKTAINMFITQNNLQQNYNHMPSLQNSIYFDCTDKNCPEIYLARNCSGSICIIFPLSHKILKTNKKELFKTLLKAKDWTN